MTVRTGTDPGLFVRFGDLLKHLRQRARLTQRELGVAVGYSDAHITRLEAGQRQPDPSVVRARFLDALDLREESAFAQRLLDLATPGSSQGTSSTPSLEVMAAVERITNLPAQLSDFIGRERAIAEVISLIRAHRLVTLTGSGGVGKTRLAQEVGHAVLAASPDGVWLAELAPLTDPTLVPRAVAAALGVFEVHDRPLLDTLIDFIGDKHLLLLLDNCEHLIDACAHLADALLRQCRGVRILATSREALGVVGELAWRVPSLPDADAVRLFAERAALALPTFKLTPANTPAVQHICARLDGIPLAIELAAARVKALTVEKIAERLSDRFRLLTGGSRTALPRQQTLRATIDWSYHLLAEPERALLRRLSVFMGGWTLEAAEVVCGNEMLDVLDSLSRLVDKSLVVADEAGRYHMLETIRQYAREKLADIDEGPPIRGRHLDYFVGLAEAMEPQMERTSHGALDRMALEFDNVRTALGWAKETQRVEEGLRLAAALYVFWNVRGHQTEGLAWLRDLLTQPVPQPNTVGRVRALLSLSHTLMRYENREVESEAALSDALDIAVSLRLEHELARAYMAAGWKRLRRNDFPGAKQYMDQALKVPHAHDDKYLIQNALRGWAYMAFAEGDVAGAFEYGRQALAADPDNLQWNASMVRTFGYWHLEAGDDLQAARARFRESLTWNVEIADTQGMAASLSAFAGLALATGDLRQAGQLLGAVAATIDKIHIPLQPDDLARYRQYTAAVGQQLGQAALADAWADGRRMTLEQAVAAELVEDA